MNKPDIITIKVRDCCGTYIATAPAVKVKASCTSGRNEAALACAEKVYGFGKFSISTDPDDKGSIYTATRMMAAMTDEAPHGAPANGGAWRTDFPDDGIRVLVRYKDKEFPVSIGYHDNGEWCDVEGFVAEYPVTGWMHLHEAARILDAAAGQRD